MGYYVKTIDSEVFLHNKDFDAAYKKLCELNNYDELKRGGSFGGNTDQNPEEKYNRSKWFSWMDYNYPDTCPDMQSVLTQVGFSCCFDDDGNLTSLIYDENKTGNEDYFLCALAEFMKDGSYLIFKGEEDDDYFRYIYMNKTMYIERGTMSITWGYPSRYTFGELSEVDAQMKELFSNSKPSIA